MAEPNSGEELVRQNTLLEAINRIFAEALSCETEEQLGQVCLTSALELTGSQFGFIGQINVEGDLDEVAVSGLGGGCQRTSPPPPGRRPSLKLQGLYRQVVREGRAVVSNELGTDWSGQAAGLPGGHPPLQSFLGLPLVAAGTVLGLISVVNRQGGYDSRQTAALEAIAPAIVQALLRKKAERALADANHARDIFFNTLSHELRTPLAAMQNALEVLKKPEINKSQRTRVLGILERNIRQQTRLIDDLLDLSRILRGKVIMAQESLDLRELLAAQLETAQPAASQAGLELTLQAPVPVTVVGDPVRLGQIISNLIINAIKFTQAGGFIRVCLDQQEGEARVSVTDTGTGVPADLLPRIFEPFYQVDSGLARSRGGLGIGLAVARSLAELHRGKVLACSEGAGKGSTFTLCVPAGADPAGRSTALPTTEHFELFHGRRVLVIEDNQDLRESLVMLLELMGHQVLAAPDGRRGLESALQDRPEAALVDIGLPDIDGYEVARTLRSKLPAGSIRLIALTGYATPEHRERAAAAGFDLHLAKPVDLEHLRSALEP